MNINDIVPDFSEIVKLKEENRIMKKALINLQYLTILEVDDLDFELGKEWQSRVIDGENIAQKALQAIKDIK
ncbi:hypothetical protein LaPh949_gp026 [Lactococcus phage 949]|uniref:Uncharacterized protein n=1 Tax=Lactococcus phage 949 TaxID=881953 RepID=E0YIR3_9CAUD|nr:hypothetical protein LaPh949_gp026 [Lactococcus phage 949]ADM73584.1 hypothetical protein [Lactococcus phage 949]